MTDCPICHDIITKETGITTLSCSHSFHIRCIMQWISIKNTCPCCRGILNEHEKIDDLIIDLDTTSSATIDSFIIRLNATTQRNAEVNSEIYEIINQLNQVEIYGEDTTETDLLTGSDTPSFVPSFNWYSDIPDIQLPPAIQRIQMNPEISND
jgi:hypothetical protein